MDKQAKLWTSSFVLVCLGHFFMAMSFYMLVPTLPIYSSNQLLASKEQIGTIVGIYTLAAILIRPLAGYLADITGRKWIYLISFILYALTFTFYTSASSIFLLVICRIVHGISWGTVTNSSTTLAVDIIPQKHRGEGIGFYGLSMTLAMAFGPLLAIFFYKKVNNDTFFIIASLLAFIGFSLALFINYPKIEKRLNTSKFDWQRIIEIKAIPLAFNIFLIMLTYGTILSFITIYAEENKIKNPAIFFFVYAIALSISRAFSGRIFDKYGHKLLNSVGFSLIISGFPILAFMQNQIGYILSAFLIGIGNGIILPSFTAMVNNLFHQNRRGSANSTFMIFFDLGISAGAFFTGLLCDKLNFSLSQAFLTCTFFVIISLLYYIFSSASIYEKHKISP